MEISSSTELEQRLQANVDVPRLTLALYYAQWHPPAMQMHSMLGLLSSDFPQVVFVAIDGDKAGGMLGEQKVESLPTAVLFVNGNEVWRLVGPNPPGLLAKLTEVTTAPPACSLPLPRAETMAAKLQRLTTAAPVVLFMKGTREHPFCKFSKATLALLAELQFSQFGTFDIFSDEAVRVALKTFSDWPTFPQLYVSGEFVGGLDIMREMHEGGELLPLLQGAVVPKPPGGLKGGRLRVVVERKLVTLLYWGGSQQSEAERDHVSTILGMASATALEVDVALDPQLAEDLGHELAARGMHAGMKDRCYLFVNGGLFGGVSEVRALAREGVERLRCLMVCG